MNNYNSVGKIHNKIYELSPMGAWVKRLSLYYVPVEV